MFEDAVRLTARALELERARAAYIAGRIEVDELERRIGLALADDHSDPRAFAVERLDVGISTKRELR